MARDSFVVTFGCRLNTLESEKIKRDLRQKGQTDIIVVNTCAVTAEAERQARQAIRKLRRENPHHKIIVTGCSATLQKDFYEAMPEVDAVVVNPQKGHVLAFGDAPRLSQFPQPTNPTPRAGIEVLRDLTSDHPASTADTNLTTPSADSSGRRTPLPFSASGDFPQDVHGHTHTGRSDLRGHSDATSARPAKDEYSSGHLENAPLFTSNADLHTPTVGPAHMMDDRAAEEAPLSGFEGRSRAFLQIQNGCNNACTFCVIRIARGRSVSFPFEKILHQAQTFAQQGVQDITLTGVDIASYEYEGQTLGRLILDLLDALPSSVRLRLSSLDPARVDDTLLEALAHPRLLPYWHLSLQSGDASVLRRMARRHSPNTVVQLAERARRVRPNLLLGADIIVGFPGETEAMFQNTCRLVEEARIAWLHIFPYSDRPGTVAQGLTPKIPMTEKKRRLRELRLVGQRLLEDTMTSLVGTFVWALVERYEEGICFGKTEHYLPFEAPACDVPIGHFGRLSVTHVRNDNGPLTLEGVFEKVEKAEPAQ